MRLTLAIPSAALLALITGSLLSGCKATTSAPPAIVAPTGPATAAELSSLKGENATLKQQIESFRDLTQRAAGSVYGVQDANKGNPEGLAKEAVAAQAQEAASALPEPTPEQKLAKERENARILAGELAAVKAEMGQAMDENRALRVAITQRDEQLAALEKRAAELQAAGERERAEAAAKLQREIDRLSGQITAANERAVQAEDKARREGLRQLGWFLLGLGSILTLIGAAIAFVSKGLEWQRAAISAGFGSLCFALHWTLLQPWFKWVAGTSVVLAVAGIAWWIMREGRSAVRTIEADEAEDTLLRIIAEVDAMKDDTTLAELKARLSRKMDDPHKALVHELRAENKRKALR